MSRRQAIVGGTTLALAPIITVREALAIEVGYTCAQLQDRGVNCKVEVSFVGADPGSPLTTSTTGIVGGHENGGGFITSGLGGNASKVPQIQPSSAGFSNATFKSVVSSYVYNTSSPSDAQNDRLRHVLQILGGSMAHNNGGSSWHGKSGTAGLRKDEKPKGREALRACAAGVGVLKSECGLSYDRAALYAAYIVRGANDYFGPGVTRKRANVLMDNVVFGSGGPTLKQIYTAILKEFKHVGKRAGYELDLMTSVTNLIGGSADAVAIAYMLVQNWLGENPFMSKDDMHAVGLDLIDTMANAGASTRVDIDSEVDDAVLRDPGRYYYNMQNIYARWKNNPSSVVSIDVDVNDDLVTRDSAGNKKVW